jgi:hypothetical protein
VSAPAQAPAPRRSGPEQGQATVELALLTPLVVFVVMLLLQVALVVRGQLAVVHAAREAVRVASVEPDPDRARAAAAGTLPGAEVEIGARPNVGSPITVRVRHTLVTDLPLVGPLFPDPELSARAVMRVER